MNEQAIERLNAAIREEIRRLPKVYDLKGEK